MTAQLPAEVFRQAFDAAPVGMLVVDANGLVVEANLELERLLGYQRFELLGQPAGKLVEGGQVFALRQPRGEAIGRHRSGAAVPVEFHCAEVSSLGPGCLLVSVLDLRARLRAEALFRLAIESAPVGMMLVDASGRIVMLNARLEQTFGYSREELLGQPAEVLLPARFRAQHAVSRGTYFSEPRVRKMGSTLEFSGERKDGREVPLEIGLSPVQTPQGLLVLSSVVDISERKRAREQQQRALATNEMLLDELQHRVGRDLRLLADLLEHSSAPLDDLPACVQSIAQVNELLLESAASPDIDLSDHLRALVEAVTLSPFRVGGDIDVRVEAPALSLPFNTVLMCGLIINELLAGALRRGLPGRQGGRIVVRASGATGRIRLSIQDEGVGLPEGSLKLDLVQAMVRQLEGQLHVEAASGTHITVEFQAPLTSS